ncbi:MAG: DUF4874 domain-containing protein [Bacteroidales bacterium]|nr:DUF4874 domain-containing protein [Bacteroidales bacterium]
MKRLFILASTVIALCLAGCNPEDDGPKTATKPKELEDPELSISGVPSSAIQSGDSFVITVITKSGGNVNVTVDKPTVAVVKPKGDLMYEITATTASDVKVKITASQEEEKDKFKAATADATFSVKGAGTSELPGPDDSISGTAVSFTEADGKVANPERGLYYAHECHSDKYPMETSQVKSKRTSGRTVCLIEFYLTEFMSGSISSAYLKTIQDSFDAVRDGGAKAIVRFAYRDHNSSSEDQDPSAEIVLKHISQVKPILQKNEDVLFCLQAGFIGTWGEWYYTTHFNDMRSRKQVTDALLDAVPASRQIQLRTPAFKMKLYDLTVKDTLTAATAHDGSIASRLAGHNDCFGADKNDKGTFDGDATREFWKADTRYTIMGGETCEVSDYCLCPATLKDLEDYHWTYLHDGYHHDVLSRWKTDGCFDEIESRLGYRLVLKDVHYESLEAGKPCKVTIRLYNNGFAAPMNPREAWLVWETPSGALEKTLLGSDPRNWHPGYNAAVASFTPSTAKGILYLGLSDPLLPDRPEYSIAFANKNVFDSKSGLNKLFEVK